ncbi:DNA repair protein complementing XP-C cells homolog [Musca vetustissima]|uniref:DNA repair protein complementing XP-C cells homolog n=1 Tax=Musca vetustissima TaxID=27455 RepID=UPI002AB7B90E|nr:DNA repair protein complementing XP-C cells homolog [Musca vetustissima]
MYVNSSQYADTSTTASSDISHSGNLEIHIELPGRQQKDKKTRTQQDLEMALKRKFNRDMRERQLLMHKASLLCHFGRTYRYNRLLNDTILMQKSLKLLPSKNAYPPERGTEIKYYQSLVTWFKSTIQLNSQNLYPDKKAIKKKAMAHRQLLMQIENKQARCKQDYIFIFIILLRGMGLQCRLINNMQPLPLKPQQSDLISMKVKKEDDKDEGKRATVKTTGDEKKTTTTSKHVEKPGTSSKIKAVKEETVKRDNKHNESKEKPNCSKSAVEKLTKSVKTADKIKDSQEDKKELLNKSAASKEEAIPNTKTSSTSKKATDKPNLNKLTVPKAAVKIEKATINVQKDTSTDEEKHLENLDNISKDTSAAKPKISRMRSKSSEPTHADSNKSSSTQAVKSERKARAKNPVTKAKTRGKSTDTLSLVQTSNEKQPEVTVKQEHNSANNEELENSQKENSPKPKKANLARLKRNNVADDPDKPPKKKLVIESGTPLIPTVVIKGGKEIVNDTPSTEDPPTTSTRTRATRSRSKSPQIHISTAFLQTKQYREKFPGIIQQNTNVKNRQDRGKSPSEKVKISADFLSHVDKKTTNKRVLRSSQKPNESETVEAQKSTVHLQIPQMDGAHDDNTQTQGSRNKKSTRKKKLTSQTNVSHDSDEDFEPSPIKKPKIAPTVAKKDRRVLSTDEESSPDRQRKPTAGDMWVEVWSDVEEQWICLDLFKGKIHCVDTIRKSASPNMAYIFAFQNDLSIKDVTARYNPHWTNVVRKSRVEKSWLDTALQKYLGHRTKRDIKEDQELRRIHEEKPLPTSISDYKNHPFYALERHLLKFEAIYPPTAPTLGFIRGEAVYSRDCVHTLHSREIWLKQARVVKLGEKPYKIVKARPKWDRITQTIIKDQPLEIFGYWQTEEYDPPTAENGIVPRNAYGNVELFKPTMLPKKCVHMRLPGLNRVCKKLGIDCANAVVGFDFHQGACHPTYDGFVICEEFQDQVTAAWYQEQEEQERKEQEKYEARVYGNWKKLIRGLLIRERLKLKYGL